MAKIAQIRQGVLQNERRAGGILQGRPGSRLWRLVRGDCQPDAGRVERKVELSSYRNRNQRQLEAGTDKTRGWVKQGDGKQTSRPIGPARSIKNLLAGSGFARNQSLSEQVLVVLFSSFHRILQVRQSFKFDKAAMSPKVVFSEASLSFFTALAVLSAFLRFSFSALARSSAASS